MILLGNKVDLNHMQAVKSDKHFKFASSHNIKAYYCSAKTGDQVSSIFFRITAELAGVTVSKAEMEMVQKHVMAEIINHNEPPDKKILVDESEKAASVKAAARQGVQSQKTCLFF